jgi:hypothetical protein
VAARHALQKAEESETSVALSVSYLDGLHLSLIHLPPTQFIKQLMAVDELVARVTHALLLERIGPARISQHRVVRKRAQERLERGY